MTKARGLLLLRFLHGAYSHLARYTQVLISITEAELLQNDVGAHSSCSFTMEEVLDILDDVEEVICDGSDNNLGMGSDSDDSEVDDQRYILYNKIQ